MNQSDRENSKRIAKNTLLLYARMLLLMAVGLYTSRVVLATLGVEDYGVYNVVAGFVLMFSFFTSSLGVAISRYLTYELGRGETETLKKIFSTSVNVQLLMAVFIVVLAELVGIWFLNHKLNIPDGHPAKDEQDTFYVNKDIVLRTQTSSVQARVMENTKPPIRVISPGRVFRSDEVDATHSPSFHQIEGLVIDKNVSFADLKGTLEVFAKELFGPETKTKFRPHHFPFTEPSAEVDVSCFKCGGKGCRFCKGSGWIEILGCGMVHPHVLEMCGIDPEVYSGFAFGVGLERIALLKYEIDDMRLLYENDIRFLRQF